MPVGSPNRDSVMWRARRRSSTIAEPARPGRRPCRTTPRHDRSALAPSGNRRTQKSSAGRYLWPRLSCSRHKATRRFTRKRRCPQNRHAVRPRPIAPQRPSCPSPDPPFCRRLCRHLLRRKVWRSRAGPALVRPQPLMDPLPSWRMEPRTGQTTVASIARRLRLFHHPGGARKRCRVGASLGSKMARSWIAPCSITTSAIASVSVPIIQTRCRTLARVSAPK